MHLLPENCTADDVKKADTETIYYSFNSSTMNYTLSAYIEMAAQLTMRGL